ncbi:hypothetical protein QJQ45_012686 [Haematococcus lacustris]|nr:hypothetical protein QJQ45_012686 [Haematococcus lacustris]
MLELMAESCTRRFTWSAHAPRTGMPRVQQQHCCQSRLEGRVQGWLDSDCPANQPANQPGARGVMRLNRHSGRKWKLTKGQVKHASGLNNSRWDTERWLAPIKPNLQHLAAASSAGTSLDAVWEVYLDPKWAGQRLRLYGAQDRALEQLFKKLKVDMAEVSMKQHGHAKQLVMFFDAASIGNGGGWGADAVLRACCKVVCRPRGSDQRRGRVVLVDEHRTTRVSSAVNDQQPCEEELDHEQPTSKRTKAEPEAAEPTQHTKAAKAKPAPQPGRWLDRDCNAALNMQRIGESRWRPLELCYWPEQGKLPAKGKEYPEHGYKQLRDKPPKAEEQEQQPAPLC